MNNLIILFFKSIFLVPVQDDFPGYYQQPRPEPQYELIIFSLLFIILVGSILFIILLIKYSEKKKQINIMQNYNANITKQLKNYQNLN